VGSGHDVERASLSEALRRGHRARRTMGVAYLALAVAALLWEARVARHPDYFLPVLYLVGGCLFLARRPPSVDREGVRITTVLLRRRMISWLDVEAVIQPAKYDASQVVRLRLKSGEQVWITRLPTARAAAIAELGGVPLVVSDPSRGTSPPARSSRPEPETLSQTELDRKFAALKAKNEWLNSQLKRPPASP
jgi:hypothetical protein